MRTRKQNDELAFALVELGISRVDYLALTPTEFAACARAWEKRVMREERRTALLLCQTANIHRDPKKRPTPFTLEDFLGKQKRTDEEEQLMILKETL